MNSPDLPHPCVLCGLPITDSAIPDHERSLHPTLFHLKAATEQLIVAVHKDVSFLPGVMANAAGYILLAALITALNVFPLGIGICIFLIVAQ